MEINRSVRNQLFAQGSLAVALLLATVRALPARDRATRAGQWRTAHPGYRWHSGDSRCGTGHCRGGVGLIRHRTICV